MIDGVPKGIADQEALIRLTGFYFGDKSGSLASCVPKCFWPRLAVPGPHTRTVLYVAYRKLHNSNHECPRRSLPGTGSSYLCVCLLLAVPFVQYLCDGLLESIHHLDL